MMDQANHTALVTGASSGIGKVYADRLAKRGYNLVLVARDEARMQTLAERLRKETGVEIEILRADLTDVADLARVEARLRDDAAIDLLVNNAGAAAPGSFAAPDLDVLQNLIALNVTSVTRLAGAAVPGFLHRGKGSIINIASVLAFAPEIGLGIYSATKAFVLTLSQSIQNELGAKGIYVQAVLPAATRTEIWQRSGRNVDDLKGVMDVEEMVDAALLGFDCKELVTIPSLPDAGQWDSFTAARQAMLPNIAQEHVAARYRA